MDAQFRLDRIDDLPGLMRRRAEAAARALSDRPCERALRYAAAPGCTLNLFRPPGEAHSATLMFIHGGFWRSLDADLFSFVAPSFVDAGAAVAVIDYPLMPAVRMADVVEACFAAVRFLHREAASLRLDPQRLYVCGNSAGGHLVSELLDAQSQRRRGMPSTAVSGACAISGLYDLEPVRRSFQNEALGLTPQEVAEFSPLRRPYRPSAPLIATVGGSEMEEFLAQNRRFADVCRATEVAVEHREEAAMDHLTVVLDALADPTQALHRRVRAMMGLPQP